MQLETGKSFGGITHTLQNAPAHSLIQNDSFMITSWETFHSAFGHLIQPTVVVKFGKVLQTSCTPQNVLCHIQSVKCTVISWEQLLSFWASYPTQSYCEISIVSNFLAARLGINATQRHARPLRSWKVWVIFTSYIPQKKLLSKHSSAITQNSLSRTRGYINIWAVVPPLASQSFVLRKLLHCVLLAGFCCSTSKLQETQPCTPDSRGMVINLWISLPLPCKLLWCCKDAGTLRECFLFPQGCPSTTYISRGWLQWPFIPFHVSK